MSKNIYKNRKQNNRVRGSKTGKICSRIRKTQSLLHPAFLLSDAGNPPSVCLRQNLYEEEKTISNQPIIFNITYTPWKLKSNATVQERKKFERERPYYEMRDGGNNIYKYMTTDRKLNGENSKSDMRDMIVYFEKSTGVFNGDGFISQQELKAIQERAKANKILWHGFISLNEEMSRKIDMPEKCMRLIKRTFGEFFRDMGLDPKNIDLICSLHKDKPHHLHIHFWFAEKEPKCKYRKRELEYRHKGKIEKAVIDRMHIRLNAFIDERTDKFYRTRDEALRELKKMTHLRSIVSEEDVRKELIALAKAIPKDASFFYNKKDMLPHREQIDKTVNRLLLYDKRARKADKMFYERLAGIQRKIDDLCEPIKSGNHYAIEAQNITLIRELEEDYKRRQGNIVLRAVEYIKPEIYERKFRNKVNDNSLKRKLAISRYKVGKLIGSFLSSFGEESEYLSRDYTDRLKEIEDEMEAERKEREWQEERAAKAASRYDYGKE